MPEPPRTLEGWYALHEFRRVEWARWKGLPIAERQAIVAEAREFWQAAEEHRDAPEGASAVYSVLGHKADLLFLHLRPTPDHLSALERAFARTRLADFTAETYSYFSVTELSFHEAQARGAMQNPMEIPFVKARLKPQMPDKRYLCFYPMNKRRGEHLNWYALPMEERQAMMREHGTTGQRYFRVVKQMITGSVGLDDWEWGVTLFADDPLQFKKLVYEMRFDEVSAKYAEFGPFLVGIRVRPEELDGVLNG
ncbi:MAG: heme-dependent peroxidase [Armatimonadetes bacterium]|nr:heme-dependent peroxidase [Armatimonadota bacterium]